MIVPASGRWRSARCALLALLIALGTLTVSGCGGRHVVAGRAPQAYYRTGFPERDISGSVERALEAVKRVQVRGTYQTYRFELADSITDADVALPATYARAHEAYTSTNTKLGTGTVIRVRGSEVTLLTNDHVMRMPDTVVVHHRETRPGARRAGQYVESVSIRRELQHMVVGLPPNRGLRVLARDSVLDVVAITVELLDEPGTTVPVMTIRTGDPRRLSWGSFLYVIGFPGGFRMITRAIVSEPNRGPEGSFLLDGLFNRGISGGPILAVRGDTDELEWVGLATSAAAQQEYVLLPEPRQLDEEGLLVPYTGTLYVERVARLQYGITFSVPMRGIQRFLRQAGIPLRGD